MGNQIRLKPLLVNGLIINQQALLNAISKKFFYTLLSRGPTPRPSPSLEVE
ncbi:MAG: hypothetical protein F6K48_00075 [Okeania sp. SIO3H1]|nr:hypothetical protein [Okeania sp. SIO3H1]